jgi:molybdate transport system regulatory protein
MVTTAVPERGTDVVTPHVKLFLSSPQVDGLFGGGKWRLLSAVQEEGSLQKAAKLLGRSYRKAWGDIKRAEEGLGRSLVTRTRGGARGGGATRLTEFGTQLLEAWDTFSSSVRRDAVRHYEQILLPLIEEPR